MHSCASLQQQQHLGHLRSNHRITLLTGIVASHGTHPITNHNFINCSNRAYPVFSGRMRQELFNEARRSLPGSSDAQKKVIHGRRPNVLDLSFAQHGVGDTSGSRSLVLKSGPAKHLTDSAMLALFDMALTLFEKRVKKNTILTMRFIIMRHRNLTLVSINTILKTICFPKHLVTILLKKPRQPSWLLIFNGFWKYCPTVRERSY